LEARKKDALFSGDKTQLAGTGKAVKKMLMLAFEKSPNTENGILNAGFIHWHNSTTLGAL